MPLYYLDDSNMLFLLIIAFVFSLWAQFAVRHNYSRFSKVHACGGLTAEQAAMAILRSGGVEDVTIHPVPGKLTDHYDPKTNTIALSEGVYGQTSLAAIGIAAHEAGHALQYAKDYFPIRLRGVVLPLARIGTYAAFPLILLGLFWNTSASQLFINIGIIAYAAVVLFYLITLPVEYNASNRAMQMLTEQVIVTQEEIPGVRKVLRAAGLTYVAAAASATLQLLRLLLISRRRN